MKKFLALYLILATKMLPVMQSTKYYLELPLNPKCEAMGLSGIVFGKEYGSFYLAPISILSKRLRDYYRLDIKVNGELSTSFKHDVFFNVRLQVYNFSAGFFSRHINYNKLEENIKLISPFLSIPLQYSFEVSNFSFGLGAVHNILSRAIFQFDIITSLNFSSMYRSNCGNFSLALNNFFSTSYREKMLSDAYYENNIYLKKNLRIGYGKEFTLNYLFDKIQLAFELDNLLMNSLYINYDEKDYYLFRKIHLGLCAVKDIDSNSIELRVGCKNLFPTFGIEFSIKDTFKIEYTFTNLDLGEEWGKKRKLINLLSVRIEGP